MNWIKVGKVALTIGAALLFGTVVYKTAKSIEKKETLEKEGFEAEEKQQLESVGINKETLLEDTGKKSVQEVKHDLPKAVFSSISRNPEWDLDLIDPNKALEVDALLHITQRYNKERDKNYVDLVFELPEIGIFKSESSRKKPLGFKHLRKLFNDAREHIKRTLDYPGHIYSNMEGYYVIEYDIIGEVLGEDEDRPQLIIKIPQEHYSRFAEEYHDGLGNYFYNKANNSLDYNDGEEWDLVAAIGDLKENLPNLDVTKVENIKVLNAILTWRISLDVDNVDIAKFMKVLRWIVDDEDGFRLCSDWGNKCTIEYRNIMTHPYKDDIGGWDRLSQYCINDGNEVDTLPYFY